MNTDLRQMESPRYRSILRPSASSGEKRPVENESHRSDSGDEVPLQRSSRNKRVRFDLDNSRQGQEPLRFIPSRPDEGECDEPEVSEMSLMSDVSDLGESDLDSGSSPSTPATEPTIGSSVVEEIMPHEQRDDDGQSDDGESNRDSSSIPSTSSTAPTTCSSVEKIMQPDCCETLLTKMAMSAEVKRRLDILKEPFEFDDSYWCNGDDESLQLTNLFYRRVPQNSRGLLYTHKLQIGGIQNRVEDFVLLASPPGIKVKTRITQVKKGIAGRFHPIYYMHLDLETLEDTKCLIMIAKKETTFGGGTGYIISTNPNELSIDNVSCVGKISSNFFGTEFILRTGRPPTQDRGKFMEPKWKRFKEELLKVAYKTNVFGEGPRKSKVVIPKMRNLQRELVRLSDVNVDQPIWNVDKQSHILDFSEILSKNSLKSFEIVYKDIVGIEHRYLQFQQTSENSFKLDFQYPFCPLQAFALALTSLD